jgi:O-antigen ligase
MEKHVASTTLNRFVFVGLLIYTVSTFGSMAMMSIGVAFFLTAWIVGTCWSSGGPRGVLNDLKFAISHPSIKRYLIASLLLCLAGVISLITARVFPLQFHEKSVSLRGLRDIAKFWYFFLPIFLTIGWSKISILQRNQVVRTWILAYGLLSAVGLIQLFTGWPRAEPNYYIPGLFLIVLLFGHHLSLANIWIFPFFACLDFLKSSDSRKKLKLPVWTLLIIASLGAFCLFFSWSRTLWVALPISLSLWIALQFREKKVIFGFLAVIALTVTILINIPTVRIRLHAPSGTGDRYELWQANLDFLKHRPLTGVGFGKNQELSLYYFQEKYPKQTDFFIGHAHNVYLEIIAGLGILGLLAWIGWLWVTLKNLKRTELLPSTVQFKSGLICAWLTFFINGLTQVNFWEGKVLHQIMWTTGLLLFWTLEEKPIPQRRK